MSGAGTVVAGRYDVAVVGGGVVGCAVARRFALEGARIILLERSVDILAGPSKANSALLHTGFDATPGASSWPVFARAMPNISKSMSG